MAVPPGVEPPPPAVDDDDDVPDEAFADAAALPLDDEDSDDGLEFVDALEGPV
jgi:hypothetical protein